MKPPITLLKHNKTSIIAPNCEHLLPTSMVRRFNLYLLPIDTNSKKPRYLCEKNRERLDNRYKHIRLEVYERETSISGKQSIIDHNTEIVKR